MKKTSSKILKITPKGKQTVYDFTVEHEHRILANDFYTSNCSHPDIIDFIRVKGGADKSKVQYANISVKITNDFMNTLLDDGDWKMTYVLKDGSKFEKIEKASTIWDLFVESNWNGAEPGLLFWDRMTSGDPSGVFDETACVSTNPCGEQNLAVGESCCLGSLDLNKFVKNSFTDHAMFDFTVFSEMVKYSIRFLDNINILNLDREPLEINKIAALLGNRVGLGFTGLADCLIRMNLKYGSQESLEFIDKLCFSLYCNSIKASNELAKERGSCGVLNKYKESGQFSQWLNHPYFDEYYKYDMSNIIDMNNYGTRNIGYTTVAPSGSISIIAQTSSGIEPIFQLSYDRTVHQAGKNGKKEKYTVYHPLVLEYNKIFGENAHLKNPNFITSSQIKWEDRVNLQATIQKYISASISSTINLPKETTKETISEIYKYAWKKGLKGVTVYRDGCREGVLNATEADKREWQVLENVKFPTRFNANGIVIKSENRKWYVSFPMDQETNLPMGCFVHTNAIETNILTEEVLEYLIKLAKKHIKNGHLEKLMSNSHNQKNVIKIARVIGLLLRHRVPIIQIIKTIEEINPPIYSFIFQIKKLLGEYLPQGTLTGEKCSECGSLLIYEGGCSICRECGNTKCG